MAWLGWISEYWFSLLQTIGIVGGLVFTGASFRADARERRVQNLLALTKGHRAIWSSVYSNPKLGRVLDPNADLKRKPVTHEEAIFVTSLVLHLGSAYRAIQEGMLFPPEKLANDISQFFSSPVPRRVWENLKDGQDTDLVLFIESCTTHHALIVDEVGPPSGAATKSR